MNSLPQIRVVVSDGRVLSVEHRGDKRQVKSERFDLVQIRLGFHLAQALDLLITHHLLLSTYHLLLITYYLSFHLAQALDLPSRRGGGGEKFNQDFKRHARLAVARREKKTNQYQKLAN